MYAFITLATNVIRKRRLRGKWNVKHLRQKSNECGT
jgi:hypothetical protein